VVKASGLLDIYESLLLQMFDKKIVSFLQKNEIPLKDGQNIAQ